MSQPSKLGQAFSDGFEESLRREELREAVSRLVNLGVIHQPTVRETFAAFVRACRRAVKL